MEREAAQKKSFLPESSAGFVMALFALMLLVILGVSALSGRMYERITESRAANMQARSTLAYVSTRIALSDEEGTLSVEEGEHGDVLVINEPYVNNGYETRLYLSDGYLVEEYTPDDVEDAQTVLQKVAPCTSFSVTIDGRLATVTCDEGTRQIYVHTGEMVG